GVLPLLADRQRKLTVAHDDLARRAVRQDAHAVHLRRAEGVRDETRRVRVPLDHVDALAVELVDYVLDADAAQTDAGAHRVDALLTRVDGHLAAEPRLARDRLDLDAAAEDLRHLELEEPAQEVLVRPRDCDLRATRRLVHLEEVDL